MLLKCFWLLLFASIVGCSYVQLNQRNFSEFFVRDMAESSLKDLPFNRCRSATLRMFKNVKEKFLKSASEYEAAPFELYNNDLINVLSKHTMNLVKVLIEADENEFARALTIRFDNILACATKVLQDCALPFEAAAAPPQPESSEFNEFDAVKSIASELKAKFADISRRSARVFEASADATQAVRQSMPQREQFAEVRNLADAAQAVRQSMPQREQFAEVRNLADATQAVRQSMPQREQFAAVRRSVDVQSFSLRERLAAVRRSVDVLRNVNPSLSQSEHCAAVRFSGDATGSIQINVFSSAGAVSIASFETIEPPATSSESSQPAELPQPPQSSQPSTTPPLPSEPSLDTVAPVVPPQPSGNSESRSQMMAHVLASHLESSFPDADEETRQQILGVFYSNLLGN